MVLSSYKTEYLPLFLNFKNMHCLDYEERPQPGNQLFFMLNELVSLGCHSQFASHPYTFASYSYGCKILQPHVAATARMHPDAMFFSIGASQMKTFIKIIARQQIVVLYKQLSVWTHRTDTCESAFRG